MKPELNHSIPSRTAVLRAELVSQVAESVPPRRAAHTGRIAIGAVLAFALAGATTGGAVAATGVFTPQHTVEISMDEMQTINFPGTEFLGTPLVVTGSGETVVDLGSQPEGATALALRVSCLDPGRYDISIDGVPDSWVECGEDDVMAGPTVGGDSVTYYGGFASQYDAVGTTPQSVTVTGNALSRYVVWVSWSTLPAAVEASQQQQDALADGIVTREEYLAGLDRYIACMSEQGWSVGVIDREAEVIDYRFEAIGAADDRVCYGEQFEQLDIEWQISREDQ